MPSKPAPPEPEPDDPEPDEPAPDEPPGPSRFVPKGEWPQGDIAAGAPEEARAAQGVARRFIDCLEQFDTNINAVATATGMGPQTLYNLRDGTSYPSLVTVARLEAHFDRLLWGDEHLAGRPQPRDYLAEGEWPQGDLAADAPKEARLAQGIAAAALNHIARVGTTPEAVATKQQIDLDSLHDLINGKRWPDFSTIVRLEVHFDRRLWGHAHKRRR